MSEIILAPDAQTKIGVVLAERYTEEMTKAADLIKAVERIPQITDHKSAGQVGDYIKQLTTITGRIEYIRTTEKEPFLRTGQAIDELFNGYKKKLSEAKTTAQRPLTKFMNDEADKEAKRRRDEAAKLQQEADDRLAKAASAEALNRPTIADAQMDAALTTQKQADKAAEVATSGKMTTRAYGVEGNSTTALRKRWVAEIMDVQAIDLEALRPYFNQDHIQAALNRFMADGGRTLKGAVISEQSSAVVR